MLPALYPIVRRCMGGVCLRVLVCVSVWEEARSGFEGAACFHWGEEDGPTTQLQGERATVLLRLCEVPLPPSPVNTSLTPLPRSFRHTTLAPFTTSSGKNKRRHDKASRHGGALGARENTHARAHTSISMYAHMVILPYTGGYSLTHAGKKKCGYDTTLRLVTVMEGRGGRARTSS